MESPTEVKWLGIKPYIFRIFSGFLALWSVNQVIYLAIAWVTPVSAAVPEQLILVFPGQEIGYLTLLVFPVLPLLFLEQGQLYPAAQL